MLPVVNYKEPLPLPRPPWSKLGKKIESAIRKALYLYRMVESEHSIAVALSGGKDSLSLLYFLTAISGRGFPPFKLVAIHVSGTFSCGPSLQESYLHKICDALGVKFISKMALKEAKDLECYGCSRTRRKLIFDTAKEEGITTIAFGHHRDDNAQTILLNLLHKGEFAGTLPVLKMVDFGVKIIRPLIFVQEKALQRFASDNGFARITCQCPYGVDSMRKKVDHLLNSMEELFPNARANIANASLLYGSHKAEKKEKPQ